MAFTQVTSLDADVTISLGKKDKTTGKPYPNQAEGYYLGNRKVNTKLGETTLHFLQTPKGNLGVWGGTDMNKKLAQVQPGTMVRITAAGKRPTPRGDMNVFTVESDTDNTITVNISAAAAEDYSDTGTNETSGYSSDETEDENSDVAQSQALAAAERKAKLDAILKGGGNKGVKRN